MIALVNKVLYSNIERITEDRSMTLALLDYKDGVYTIAGQHESVGGPGAGRRQANQPFGVRVTADDPVERHDVGSVDGGRLSHEVALDEVDPVKQLEPARLLTSDVERRRRPVHQDSMPGSGPEQLVVDDADAAADVEDGRARGAVRRKQLEQHPRGPVRSVATVAVAIAVGVAAVEDRCEPVGVAPAGVHGCSLLLDLPVVGEPEDRRGTYGAACRDLRLWLRAGGPTSVRGMNTPSPAPPYGALMTRLLPTLRRGFLVANRTVAAPALRAGLGPLLATPAGGSILLLRTRGRRSGLTREAPLGYVIRDGSIYVCAGFGRATAWLANLLADPSVEVVLPGARIRATAHEVTDRAEYDIVLPQLIRALGVVGAATVPAALPPGAGVSDTWFATLPLVGIRPTGMLPGPWDPGGRGWVGVALIEMVLLALLVSRVRRGPGT
jgi:deazaflavin-dependent oxidoreductase (nitroreductase family)